MFFFNCSLIKKYEKYNYVKWLKQNQVLISSVYLVSELIYDPFWFTIVY